MHVERVVGNRFQVSGRGGEQLLDLALIHRAAVVDQVRQVIGITRFRLLAEQDHGFGEEHAALAAFV